MRNLFPSPKLSDLELNILKSIAKHYPISIDDVEMIYKELQSFDNTIQCLQAGIATNVDPTLLMEYFKI